MQTTTSKLPPLLRRMALLLPLLCLSWLAQAQNIYFNSGSLSYTTTGTADNREVEFRVRLIYTVNTEFRNPIVVGGVQPTEATIDFGDGTAPEPVRLTVLSKGSGGANNNGYYVGEFVPKHTYATAGSYTATVRGPRYIEPSPFAFTTLVGAGAANDSPVSDPAPFVILDRRQGTSTYQVPASDANGDALTYSLASAAETGSGSNPLINPAGLSIDSRTGLLRFNTANTGTTNGITYRALIRVSDGTTSILVEQNLQPVGPSPTNTPPVFTFAQDAPPAGELITVFSGTTMRFPVRARDADAGDVVTLRATGLPAGATLTPTLPTSGNPVETFFSWTPPSNIPDAIIPITFTAEDSRGAQTTVSFTLRLHGSAPPEFIAPTPADKQVFPVVPGQTVQFTVKVQDISGIFGTLISLRNNTPLPRGATLTPVVSSGGAVQFAETTFSWTPTSADVGTYIVGFVAVDRDDANTFTAVTIQVNPSCDPAATRPVANADQLSTTGGPLTITPAQLLANDTDPQGRALKVSSVGPLTQGRGSLVTNADGTFTFTPAPGFTGPASFTYQLDLNSSVLASRTTGHYYEFVNAPGISWTAALQQAGNSSYQGIRGYLATITSAAEKELLAGRSAGKYWFGAADDVVEGEWRWKAGPEAGQLFWRGAADGTATGYANWAPGEPNDYKNQYRSAGEDYAQFYGESGYWNDLSDRAEGAGIAGYVIEYGGLEDCTPVLFATGTVTINVGSATAQVQAQALARTAKSPAAQVAEKAVLEAAPNPSSGEFRLRVTAAADGPTQLDLYDLQGRRVKSLFAGNLRAGEVRELPVSAPELTTGIYLVRLQGGQRVQHLRIAVQK